MNIDDKNIISSGFDSRSINKIDSDKMYVDAGQAAVIRPNGKVTQLATDKVVGCIGLVATNTQDGSVGLVHVLANLGFSDLSEEWETLIKPTIDSLAPDGQEVEVRMFGGLYSNDNRAAGDHFVNTLTQRLESISNIKITETDIGDTPHPFAVVVDVEDASIKPASEMVSSHDEVLKNIQTGQGQLVDMSDFTKPDIPALSFGLIYDETVSGESNYEVSPDLDSLNV